MQTFIVICFIQKNEKLCKTVQYLSMQVNPTRNGSEGPEKTSRENIKQPTYSTMTQNVFEIMIDPIGNRSLTKVTEDHVRNFIYQNLR